MRISQKGEYAVAAVLDLALHAPVAGGVRSAEIARRTRAPEKFLETILLQLRRGGIVDSRRGPAGGHRLARDPALLTVGAVLAAVDGPFAPSPGARVGSPAGRCLDDLWGRVAAAAGAVVEGTTIDDLRARAAAPAGADYSI